MKEPLNPETHFESSHGVLSSTGSGVEILIRVPLDIAEDRKAKAYEFMADAARKLLWHIR